MQRMVSSYSENKSSDISFFTEKNLVHNASIYKIKWLSSKGKLILLMISVLFFIDVTVS